MALPTSVLYDGRMKVLWVPTLTAPAAPTSTELTAASSVDLTCYLTAFTPGTNENTVTDDRICSPQVFERVGSYTDTLEITYIYQPQGKTATDNAAQTTLQVYAEGYIVMRWGALYTAAVATGDVVDVYKCQCGVQRKQPGTRNETLKITQTMKVTDVVQRDVVVA